MIYAYVNCWKTRDSMNSFTQVQYIKLFTKTKHYQSDSPLNCPEKYFLLMVLELGIFFNPGGFQWGSLSNNYTMLVLCSDYTLCTESFHWPVFRDILNPDGFNKVRPRCPVSEWVSETQFSTKKYVHLYL
jgi:hypothetical protein